MDIRIPPNLPLTLDLLRNAAADFAAAPFRGNLIDMSIEQARRHAFARGILRPGEGSEIDEHAYRILTHPLVPVQDSLIYGDDFIRIRPQLGRGATRITGSNRHPFMVINIIDDQHVVLASTECSLEFPTDPAAPSGDAWQCWQISMQPNAQSQVAVALHSNGAWYDQAQMKYLIGSARRYHGPTYYLTT